MKLHKAEIAAIIITVIFIAAVVVSSLQKQNDSAAVTLSEAYETSVESTNLQDTSSLPPTISPQAPVNINTATVAELSSLPGIGETLAKRIIAYREQQGPFKNTDDIMSVSGIGAKTYKAMKSLITVD